MYQVIGSSYRIRYSTTFYGTEEFYFRDHNGYILSFSESTE
jgi:hypothetical protein